MYHDLAAHENPQLHTSLVKILINIDDHTFSEYQKLRKEWCEIQRQLLIEDPSYIPSRRERVEHLSRLKVGLPTYETDALLGRLNQQIQRISEADKEGDSLGIDAEFFEMGGGSKKNTSKKKKKGDGLDDDLFGF